MEINELSSKVIGSSVEGHKHLGPGLLESVYRTCLAYELRSCGLLVKEEVLLPVKYKSLTLDNAYRVDLIINDQLIVEIKAVNQINQIYVAQLLSYLKMSNYQLGLLINFNVPQLIKGVKRVINT